jgi:hypothetical protein
MNEQLKTQVLEQLKSANNVLVAVSSNPTVDELSASIALTLLLNKMNKHATTVFSGVVPSTLEFLQPDKTIEKTTDSLRDFIIALDKSKADKLRYKVEDDVVRIFITPYRTSITDKDLEFSQGDFNVDVVLALGVTKREDLDQAITSHGRILHDATIVSLTKREAVSQLGSVNWQEPQASSLCEMVSVLSLELDQTLIDGQMATALMTGIIAETDRFRNDKTTPLALSLSSQLMSAGANQQLIAEKLEEPELELELEPELVPETTAPIQQASTQQSSTPVQEELPRVNGELEIEHENNVEKIHIDEHGNLSPSEEKDAVLPPVDQKPLYSSVATNSAEQQNEDPGPLDTNLNIPEPEQATQPIAGDSDKSTQTNSGHDSADRLPEETNVAHDLDAPTSSNNTNDAAAVPSSDHTLPTMTHGKIIAPPHHGGMPMSDKPFDLQEALKNEIAKEETAAGTLPAPLPPIKDDSLLALEKAIDSPHLQQGSEVAAAPVGVPPEASMPLWPHQQLDSVRDSVAKAADAVVSPFPTPSKSLGAQSVDMQPPIVNTPKVVDPNTAPPVPPPMPLAPQFYDENGKSHSPISE